MILHLAKRLFFILLGYALATVASAGVVTAATLIHDYGVALPPPSEIDRVPSMFALITALIGIYAALPAALTVTAGEIRRIRARLYYMAAGCLIGTGLPIYVQIDHWYIAVGFLFGFVAGLIYWRVAGRMAGWRPESTGI